MIAVAFIVTLAAVDVGLHGVQAQTPGAEPPRNEAPAWCLQRSENERPNCVYDSFPSCVIASFKEGASCVANPGPAAAAPPADQAQRRRAARTASSQQTSAASRAAAPAQQQSAAAAQQNPQTTQASRRRKLTAAEREKIFNDFQAWRAQRGDDKAH